MPYLFHVIAWCPRGQIYLTLNSCSPIQYIHRGADKSLGQPGMKQANVSVRMAWISFGALLSCREKTWWQLASRGCWNRARPWHASELVSFLVGLRTYQHLAIHIIIININDWTLGSVPSPKLQLLSPTFLRSSNCSPSLWSVAVRFQRDSVLWHSLQVLKPIPSVFIYLV